MAHETFGPYLLLKKLTEDVLGEVFRAGRLRDGNLEQVVLLRTFNGRAVNPAAVSNGLSQQQAVQALLRSPNIGQGIDAGDFQGIPYVVYDYISGRDLGSLMRQASLRSHPVPTEHALLIAERLALALSVAGGTKVGGQPILHGFLVPEMVMLSNEGENRLLGFEAGASLRASDPSSALWQAFGRYLAPEAHAGEPLAPTDDVYSLGVVLLELLVGHTLENLGPTSLQGAIAQVAGRGLPNVAELIENSVSNKAERIQSAAAWHQDLSRLALDRQSSSTPFHLAFYMHNLFRDEIERESQEIEYERSIDFSQQRLASAPALGSSATLAQDAQAAAATPTEPSVAPPESTQSQLGSDESSGDFAAAMAATSSAASSGTAAAGPPVPPTAAAAASGASKKEESGSKLPLLLAAAALLLAVGGYFGWQWWTTQQGASTPATQIADADGPTTITPGGVTDTANATESANGGAGVDADPMADPSATTTAARESGPLGPVSDARAVAEGVESDTVDPDAVQREGLMAELDRLVAERTKTAAEDLKREYDDQVQQLRDQLAEAERQKQEEERLKQEAEAARQQAALEEKRKQEEAARQAEATRQAAAQEEAAKKAEAEAASEPETPAQRKVRVGELVQAGPGVLRPRLSGDVKPVYPFAAKRLRKEADVDVDVLVDENGKVIDTRMGDKVGFGFDDAARAAASRAEFRPASSQGVKVKMWTTIKVQFRLDR